MKKLALGFSILSLSFATHASVVMTGDFVKTAVSDDGTLGYGGATTPGILHDSTGTGTFGVDDYLTPGTSWEGFSIKSDQTGLISNNNDRSDSISGSISDISGSSAHDQAVNFLGTFSSLFSISTDTFFNDGDERISMSTTITALDDLTNLLFSRWLDPDPDVVSFGSYDTVNGRGATGLAAENWVHSEGSSTGLTIGLYTDSSITHNTGISAAWEIDPSFYLAGTNDGNGDYTIGLAFNIGSLSTGDSVTFDYSYVMGDSLETVDIPTPSVPEPTSLALLGLGLVGFGFTRKKKKA